MSLSLLLLDELTTAFIYMFSHLMSRFVLQRTFDWIVSRISVSLNHQSDALSLPFIGVLDIFGFEDFTSNGLEQLLINYANEALQLIYRYLRHFLSDGVGGEWKEIKHSACFRQLPSLCY